MQTKNKFSIWKWFNEIETDPYTFANENKRASLYKKHFFLWIFIITSFIALLSTLMLSILSSLKLAKLWFFAEGEVNNEQITNLINNYVYITNTLSAIIAFITTVVAFFAFKQGYLKNRDIYNKLDFELFQYTNEMGFYADLSEEERKKILIDRTFLIAKSTTLSKK